MYAIFFDYDGTTLRLPTNPDEIKVSSTQSIEKYEVLSLGQIAIPTYMELKEYSFDCELPGIQYNYVEVKEEFKDASFYIDTFKKWRELLVPIRFIAGRVLENDELYGDEINSLILMEDFSISEKAGEEGDKYASFKLLEYREFGKAEAKEVDESTGKIKKKSTNEVNPKNTGTYVVVSGDNLWNIAKRYYGNGALYTKIYNANKDKIKNPALIYPGQKLVIP